MKKICFLFILFFCYHISFHAQQSLKKTSNDAYFQKALTLFQNKEYSASQAFLNQIKANKNLKLEADIQYYLAQSAVRLNQKDAEQRMLNFIENYPTHPKQNSIFLEVGNYYFNLGKYAKTRKWYENVTIENLSTTEKENYYFNLGYAYYKSKRYVDAEKNFKKVANSKIYGSQANYYLGFIAYKADDYNQADTYFEEIKEDSELNKNLSYYQADRNFKKGRFNDAISSAKKELPKAKFKDKSELNKIIGESYFNLKEFKTAIPYLEAYKGDRGKWSNTDHYYLGYAYYKNGMIKKAISRFNKIIGGKDVVAQNAYYHLADSYLQIGQKQQALNAFKNAYEMPFVNEIKKDAGYNYVKLSYEIGNPFESVPSVIRTYQIKYPNTQKEELSTLLIDSYFSSKNYQEALLVLEKDNNPNNNSIYQKVLLYRGFQLYNLDKYKDALPIFKRAIKVNNETQISQQAHYWYAESLFQLNDFSNAIEAYKQVNDTYNNDILSLKPYQLGYCFFKLKNYSDAIIQFETFLKSLPELNFKQDAVLRMGDSYFASAKYWPAMEQYNKAITLNHPKADYAHYQKAISYGFVQRNEKKIADLEAFLQNFKRSKYKDDAMYALANVYIAEGKTNKGIQIYRRLQSELPNSTLVSKSILKEGLIYYNNNQPQKAIERFKAVVKKYPKSTEALQAIKSARLVYIDLGKTQEYATWVKGLDFVEITNEDLDNTTYEAAEKPYLNNNTNRAISNFESYLRQFPSGIHNLEAHFYLAQLYIRKKLNTKALPHYVEVGNRSKNEYTETAVYQVAKIHLENKAYKNAIPYLLRLEKEADFAENKTFAKTNLMKAYNETKQFEKTLAYAETVLSDTKIDTKIKADAQIYKARAAVQLQKNDIALNAYKAVAKTETNETGAEAIYFLARSEHNRGNFEKSNQLVQRLAKDFSSYQNYGAKGLVLMATNFHKLDDTYQATYILSSVIENFKRYPETVKKAKTLLAKIKSEASKTNSSINE